MYLKTNNYLQVGEDLDGLDGVGDLVLHGGSGLGLLALVLIDGGRHLRKQKTKPMKFVQKKEYLCVQQNA